jgi:DNA transformation protein and related proteins
VTEADISDVFAAFGPVRLRRMFGGTGIYADDVMIGLEAYGEIYLKADTVSQPTFEAAGSLPFVYEKDGRTATMSYWLLPDEAREEPDAVVPWARLALEAAKRKPAKASRRKR